MHSKRSRTPRRHSLATNRLSEKKTARPAAQIKAEALDALGRAEEAAALRARYRIESGQSQI
jgi:hypothetical protein